MRVVKTRPLLSWAWALVATWLALAPVPLGAQAAPRSPVEKEHPEVKDLKLVGVQSVDPKELERNIATDESECVNLLVQTLFCWWTHAPAFWQRHFLDREELKRDVLRIRVFYWKRGYRHTEVDTLVTPNGDGVTVTFNVRENEPTRITRLAVLWDSTTITTRRMRRLVRMRAGDPLHLLALDSARIHLTNEMWERGYPDAVVDTTVVVDSAQLRAQVTIAIAPGKRATVGAITVRGNEEIAARTIVNTLTLETGKLFRRSDVLQSQRNLYESNLFRQAIVEVPPQADSVKDVVITVTEAPLHEARVGGGFNTIEFFQVDGRFTHYNVLGGARRLDITGAVGNLFARSLSGRGIFHTLGEPSDLEKVGSAYFQPTWNASAEFKQPAFLQRPENALGVGAFAHRRSAPQVFIDHGYGGNLTYTRNLAERAQASASYRFELTRVEANDVYFCINFGVCDDSTVALLQRTQRLSPIIASYHKDRSDEPFSPTTGYIIRADAEHASSFTASQYRYNRAFAAGTVYWPVRRQRLRGWASSSVSPAVAATVLAAHLRLGVIRPLSSTAHDVTVVHPRKRFYAGGSQSVRGFGENMLGPRVLTVDPLLLANVQGCDLSTAETTRRCNPNREQVQGENSGKPLEDKDFFPRPLGGTSVAEASVELRFPIWRKITGAAFVDGAIVGQATFKEFGDFVNIGSFSQGTAALTPGFGIRYHTRVGPIRIDLGYNPTVSENQPVVTEVCGAITPTPITECPTTEREIVALATPRKLTGGRNLLERLTLHLSIGQAY
jgi:outer membrane protein insertion porin family/translocation and assembly module TamA